MYSNGGPDFHRVSTGTDRNLDLPNEETKDEDGKLQTAQRKCCLHRFSSAIISFLETSFYRLGLVVGLHPKKTIALTVVIPLFLGVGLIRFHLNEDLGTLLLPPESRFIQERTWVEANIDREERLINVIIENDNVLTSKTLLAMLDVVQFVTQVQAEDIYYTDICLKVKGRCVVSSLLDLWQYNRTIIETLTEDQILSAVNTVTINPTYFTPINTTQMLGGVTKDTSDVISSATAATIVWYHMANSTNKDIVLEVERDIVELVVNGHKDLKRLHVYTEDLYDDEFFSSLYSDLILLSMSVPLVILYLIITFGKPTRLEHGFPLMLAAIAGVLLSALTCYGVCLAAGLSFGVTHQALAFLLLAIGVDDAFVILESMKRVKRRDTDAPLHVQVAMTMKSAGVSVTVTSLSDVVAFATGITTNMPILSSFCVYSSVGVLALYIIQSTLFPACMVLNERRINARKDAFVPCIVLQDTYKPNRWKDIEIVETFFTRFYGPFVTSVPGKVIVLLMTVGIGCSMTWSLTHLEKGYDFQRGVPADSLSSKFIAVNDKYFQEVGTGITVYCVDVDLQRDIFQLEAMVQKLEKSEANNLGQVVSWLPAYKYWLAASNNTHILYNGSAVDEDRFYRLLHQFTDQSDYGAIFANDIHYFNSSATSKLQRTEFYFVSRFQEKSAVIKRNMDQVREIADGANTTTGHCFSFSKFFMFAEVLEYVDVEVLRNFVLAGVAVFIVTMVLIVDPLVSLFVLLCVILTTISLGGTMHFIGYKMDGNMVILLTFCIGLAVDFSAHVGHMFMTVKGTRNERVRETISRIGPAIFHGGFSTFLGISGLAFGKSFSLSLFFYTFLTVVIFGLFHGLCLLPVVLSIIGPLPYNNHPTKRDKVPAKLETVETVLTDRLTSV